MALLLPPVRLPGRAGRAVPALAALGGIGVAGGSLMGLLVSEQTPLFGFMEFGYRPAIVIAIACEAAAVLLGAHLMARRAALQRARARIPRARRALQSGAWTTSSSGASPSTSHPGQAQPKYEKLVMRDGPLLPAGHAPDGRAVLRAARAVGRQLRAARPLAEDELGGLAHALGNAADQHGRDDRVAPGLEVVADLVGRAR